MLSSLGRPLRAGRSTLVQLGSLVAVGLGEAGMDIVTRALATETFDPTGVRAARGCIRVFLSAIC